MSIATVSGEPSEGRQRAGRQPRGPRPPKRRAPIRLETALKDARPPRPLPEPEAIDAVASADMHHMHGGGDSHFPSAEDELPKPEAWEPEAQPGRREERAHAEAHSPPPAPRQGPGDGQGHGH